MLHILWILIKFILIILGIPAGTCASGSASSVVLPGTLPGEGCEGDRQLQGDRTGSQNYLAVPRHRRQVLLS